MDSGGVYVVPSFIDLGTPYWKPQIKGDMFGLTGGTTQEHITHATLETLAYQINDVLRATKRDSGLSIVQMQMGGGAGHSNYLLQSQNDIIDTCIVHSTTSETTVLGTTYLSGSAMGFWKSKEGIRSQFQVSRHFTPQMDAQQRIACLQGWSKAIHAIFDF